MPVAPGAGGAPVPSSQCAESWGTSVRRTRWTSSSKGCAGWSTGVTTRPASPSVGPTATAELRRRRPASWPTWRRCSPTSPLPAATLGIGHTRWATHGGADRPQRPPAPVRRRLGRRDPQRHHRELRRAARRVRGGRRRVRLRDRHRGRRAPARRRLPRAARRAPAGWPTRCAPSAAGSRAPSPWWPPHADEPDTLVGSRRNSPLVVGVGDGEYFLGSDVSAFIAHTRDALELGQDQVVEIDRTRGVTVTDFAGDPVEPKAYTVDWDAAAAEKGGYDWFMLKEIAEQPQAIADTLLGRLGDARRAGARRGAALRPGTARRRQGLRRRLRHRLPRRADRQVRDRALDPHPGRGRAGQRVPLPRPGARPLARWSSSISQSGETMDTLMALRHAKEQKARVLAICNANGSTIPRESDAVLYTHAGPGGRGRLDQGVPHPARRLLPRRALPRPGPRASSTRTRSRRSSPTCGGCPTRSPRCSPAWSRCASSARSLADADKSALPRPARRATRWRSRAR